MFDVLVVGGSFAGLSAAMQLARARRTVCVVDSGTPRNRFAAESHGFFGQDRMAPSHMVATAREKLTGVSHGHICGGLRRRSRISWYAHSGHPVFGKVAPRQQAYPCLWSYR
jgi:glycine/D-amino acid oxidase-like deaminating enzyme